MHRSKAGTPALRSPVQCVRAHIKIPFIFNTQLEIRNEGGNNLITLLMAHRMRNTHFRIAYNHQYFTSKDPSSNHNGNTRFVDLNYVPLPSYGMKFNA